MIAFTISPIISINKRSLSILPKVFLGDIITRIKPTINRMNINVSTPFTSIIV